METRANYVATGAFVLLLLAGIAAAAVWLAGAQFRQQYTLYETHALGSVSGLDPNAPVRLNGLDIGHVAKIEQTPDDPEHVELILQIRQEVVIRADAVASLEMQGLTGGRYVEISGGTRGAPRLVATAGQRYPEIAFRESSLDALLNDTPNLMNRLVGITDNLQAVLNEQNRQAISATLSNVRDLTGMLDQRSSDIAQLLTDGNAAVHNLSAATAGLNSLLAHLDRTSSQADQLVASANVTLTHTTRLVDDLDGVVRTSQPGLRELTTTVPAQLRALLEEANRLTESLDRVSTGLERNPSRILFGGGQEGYRPR